MIVLDFLIKHGSEQAIREMRYHIVDLQNLTSFQYMDENYQDVGQSGSWILSCLVPRSGPCGVRACVVDWGRRLISPAVLQSGRGPRRCSSCCTTRGA